MAGYTQVVVDMPPVDVFYTLKAQMASMKNCTFRGRLGAYKIKAKFLGKAGPINLVAQIYRNDNKGGRSGSSRSLVDFRRMNVLYTLIGRTRTCPIHPASEPLHKKISRYPNPLSPLF